MFTSAGQNIVAKYMLGQVPAYASYIAIGCGPTPLKSTDTQSAYNGHALEFETFRSRIISRGYVNNGNGTSDLVLTAELPTEDRYEITEIGLYPAQLNDIAGNADSKILLRFDQSELWKISGTAEIPTDPGNLDDTFSTTLGTKKISYINSDNLGLNQETRLNRQERPRFLNRSIFMRGNSTDPIVLSGLNIDLSKNGPSDKINLAFSVLSDVYTTDGAINTEITVDFLNDSGSYYRMNVPNPGSWLLNSRYQVKGITISDLVAYGSDGLAASPGDVDYPTLNNITSVKVFAQVLTGAPSAPSSDYWIALDGLRLDAISFNTSVYDLVAYKVIKNSTTILGTEYARPIVKEPNTSNFIEFRFRVSV